MIYENTSTIFDINLEYNIKAEENFPYVIEKGFNKIERTDILDIPENIRKNDRSLKYQNTYEISSDKDECKVTLGDNILGLVCKKDCKDNFLKQSKNLFSDFIKKHSKDISRIGFRKIIKIKNNKSIKIILNSLQVDNKNKITLLFEDLKGDINILTNLNKDENNFSIDIIVFSHKEYYDDIVNDFYEIADNKIKELLNDIS